MSCTAPNQSRLRAPGPVDVAMGLASIADQLPGPHTAARDALAQIRSQLAAARPDVTVACSTATAALGNVASAQSASTAPEAWLLLAVAMILQVHAEATGPAARSAAAEHFARQAVMCAGFAKLAPNPLPRKVNADHARQIAEACAAAVIAGAKAAIANAWGDNKAAPPA